MQLATRRLIRGLSHGRFTRSVAVLVGGSTIAQMIPVLFTPALTRLYSPADMGLLALYLAFIGFASSGTTLGFSLAIVSARNDNEAADLVFVSAIVVVPIAMGGACLLWLMTARSWLGYGELSSLTAVAMGVSLVLTGLYLTMRYWLIRMGRYGTISSATVAQSLGRVGTQLVLGIARAGWLGLIIGEIFGRGFGLRRMWQETWEYTSIRSLPLKPERLRKLIVDYRKFPLFSTPSAVLNSLALVLPVPLISTYFGLQAAGQFSIASRVLLLPSVLVGASVGDVFHNRIATYSREHPAKALPFLMKVSSGLLLLGLLPMLIVALFGESLWAAILGDEWSVAGQIAAVITPWALMQLAVSPVSRVVAVYQGQEFKLIYDALGLLSIFGVLTLGDRQLWSLVETCTVLGWSQAAVYGLYFLLLLHIVKRHKMINSAQ